MNWFWQYLSGYIIIEIDAENGEQILNKALQNKIHIWNLHCNCGKITGNIGVKDFLRLRHIKRGTKGKIKIKSKKGVIFKTKKYKNRIGLLLGIVLFVFVINLLSDFIWIINVEGNNKISDTAILRACNSIGIKEGVLKKKINNKYDAQRLLLTQNDIAWCSLVTEGSVLTVNLSENAVSDKEERKYPSNLKALTDGKIKKIDVTSGDTLVKVDDVVSKGDLLVSGISQNHLSELFVHSDGKIIAETKRVFSAEGKYKQSIKKPTGKSIKKYTIDFFNIKIPLYLGNIKKENNYSCKINNLKLFNKKIPIKSAVENYEIIDNDIVEYSKKDLVDLLRKDIQSQLEAFNFIKALEDSEDIVYTEVGILIKKTYICEENIALQDKILLNTEN